MSVVGEGMIDFTNNDVKAPERKNFENKETHVLRLKANQTVRIHFCSADVMMRRRHYNAKAQKGKYVRCLDYTGYCPVCVAASDKVAGCKKASETFGANILVYNMNSAGEVITPWDAEVYFWAFGAEKFVQIRQIVKEWGPINTLDFTVTCTDEDFQKMQISVCKESLYAKDADFKARMDAKIESDSYPLDKFLCKEQNIVQMCESFQLDQEKYIPLAIRQQMTGGGNAAQQAAQNYTQQTQQGGQNTNVAPPQSSQQPQQNTQQPQQSVQQNVAQPQQTQQPSYTPPKADENSFASLEEIGNLI